MRQAIPELKPYQWQIAKDNTARFKVVACGRRWGKTTLALAKVKAFLQRTDKVRQIWWVAPTYGMSFEPWMALKATFDDMAGVYKNETRRLIVHPNGSSIMMKSADNPDRLRGSGLDYLVVDEAAFIPRYVWQAILRPSLSDKRGKALLISTPRGRNWFYRVFQLGLDPLATEWKAWQAPTIQNPLISQSEIDDVRRQLPEHIFRQEYLAEFLESGGTVFRNISSVLLNAAPTAPAADKRYVMGVDWGRHYDFTVLIVLEVTSGSDPIRMVKMERFSEVNWRIQRERIAMLADHWRIDGILAEANAMGEPNIEALQDAGLPIKGFVTTSKSKPPLIESLVKAIEDEAIKLLNDQVLISELETYEFELTEHGRPRYSAPAGLHDDTVIALALAYRIAMLPRLTLSVAVA